MHLAVELRKFASACERLIATATTSGRTLTAEEADRVLYYCMEVLTKVVGRSSPPPSTAHDKTV